MESLLLIAIIAIIGFLVYYLSNTNKQEHKSSALKKEELILKYENEMKDIIEKYKDEPTVLTTKKIEYLKKASNQLHNNIFFTEQEAKALVKRLASL